MPLICGRMRLSLCGVVTATLQRYPSIMPQSLDATDNIVEGVKVAQIYASTQYPIVSAYEFEFLKEEDVIRERLGNLNDLHHRAATAHLF